MSPVAESRPACYSCALFVRTQPLTKVPRNEEPCLCLLVLGARACSKTFTAVLDQLVVHSSSSKCCPFDGSHGDQKGNE